MSPWRSRWSSLIFRTTATSACKFDVVSNWKLDNSKIYSSGSSLVRSSAGRPRFPPTATFLPAFAAIRPIKVVTVLLALEPVIATIGLSVARRKIWISLTTGIPWSSAAWISGSFGSSPGLMIISSAESNRFWSNLPKLVCTSAGIWSCPGGVALESVTATR